MFALVHPKYSPSTLRGLILHATCNLSDHVLSFQLFLEKPQRFRPTFLFKNNSFEVVVTALYFERIGENRSQYNKSAEAGNFSLI